MSEVDVDATGDELPGEAGYDLSDWTHELRGELTARMAAESVAHRWEGDEVVVAEVDADAVEAMIDELEPDAGGVGAPADGGDDAEDDGAGVLSLLYVASDVLIHDPADNAAVLDMLGITEAGRPGAPYGLDIAEWESIWARAERLAELLGDGEDDEVREAAGHLRQAVRDLV